MTNTENKAVTFLRKDLAEKEAALADLDRQAEPIREEVRKLNMAIRDLTSGAMGSGAITDDEIVRWLKANSEEKVRCRTPEIAAAFGGDGRGFSRRLPRMAREGLINGDAESGYWVGARGTRVRVRA